LRILTSQAVHIAVMIHYDLRNVI